MASMTAMGSRRGPGGAGIAGSIGRGFGKVLGYIGFILVMFMLANGLMGRATGVECIPARMGVGMLGSSNGALSTVLATTISGRV